MKKVVQQIVVMADGSIRLPVGTGEVTHGHMPVLQTVKVTLPANRMWTVVQLEIQVPDATPKKLGALLRGG